MATLEFALQGQNIKTTAVSRTVEHTGGFYTCLFVPDAIWNDFDGYMKAVFVPNFGIRQEVDIVDFECTIPQGFIHEPFFRVGVVARKDGKEYPTLLSGCIRCDNGTFTFVQNT